MAFGEHFCEFVADALARNLMNLRRELLDGVKGFRFNRVMEARGEADGAQHAKLVFGETLGGIADGADDFCVEIAASADEVEDFVGDGIEEQAVDGEVATL